MVGASVMVMIIFKISFGKNGITAENAACKSVVFVNTASHNVPKNCKQILPNIMPKSCSFLDCGNLSAKKPVKNARKK